MIGLSGIEIKILKLAERDGYTPQSDGPWWMRVLFELGLLNRYLKRLIREDLLVFFPPYMDWDNQYHKLSFETTHNGEVLLLDYWLISF